MLVLMEVSMSFVYMTISTIGVVITVDDIEKDCLIRFMHPHLPASIFFWPTRNDECN